MSRPTVRHLEYAVALAKHLSFREAAKACHVSQPALSTQVAQLEELVAAQLFERDRRHVLLTPAGGAFIEQGREILAALDNLVDRTRGVDAPFCGVLRLGVIPTIAPYMLPAALPHVRSRYPQLTLYLREDHTERLLERLKNGDLDLLLLALEAELGDVHTMELFSDNFCVAMPSGDPLCSSEKVCDSQLEGRAVLLLEDGHCLREQAWTVCQDAGAHEVVDFRATSLATLSEMVASGIGLTLLPDMARPSLHGNTRIALRPFSGKGPARTICLAWRPAAADRRVTEYRAIGEALRLAARR